MNEETKVKLLKMWEESKDKGTWSFFGGTSQWMARHGK